MGGALKPVELDSPTKKSKQHQPALEHDWRQMGGKEIQSQDVIETSSNKLQ